MSVTAIDTSALGGRVVSEPVAPSLSVTARRRKAAVLSADVLAVTLIHLVLCVAIKPHGATLRSHLAVSALAVPVWILTLSHYRLYASQSVYRRPEEVGRLVHASMTASLCSMCVAFMLRVPVERSWPLLTFAGGAVTLLCEREVVRRTFRQLRANGHMLRPVVIFGSNDEARRLVATLSADPSLGYRVVAAIDDGAGPTAIGSVPCVPSHADLADQVVQLGAGGVVIATTAIDVERSNRIARSLTEAGIHVEVSSSLLDIAPERLCVQAIGRFPVVYVRPVHYDGWRAVFKRLFDVTASLFALVAALPVLCAVAIAVKLDSNGPVLFRQERVGRDGRPFDVFKFRSMTVDAEAQLSSLLDQNEADGPLFKMRNDPRVTRVGRVIRKLSLDELPQFVNVVRGHMSLVGPRPALGRELNEWSPELHHRLRVKPGITGMWQVSGRSDLSFDDYARLDLYYVDNWSLWTDLAILAKTIPTVLLRRGGY